MSVFRDRGTGRSQDRGDGWRRGDQLALAGTPGTKRMACRGRRGLLPVTPELHALCSEDRAQLDPERASRQVMRLRYRRRERR